MCLKPLGTKSNWCLISCNKWQAESALCLYGFSGLVTDWLIDWQTNCPTDRSVDLLPWWPIDWWTNSFICLFKFVNDYALIAVLCGSEFQSCINENNDMDIFPMLNQSATMQQREAVVNIFCGWVSYCTEVFITAPLVLDISKKTYKNIYEFSVISQHMDG